MKAIISLYVCFTKEHLEGFCPYFYGNSEGIPLRYPLTFNQCAPNPEFPPDLMRTLGTRVRTPREPRSYKELTLGA